jgi:molybdenum cofactor biosynthesis protein B
MHKKKAPKKARCAVITISDSKYAFHWNGAEGVETEDISGKKIISSLEKKGHDVVSYTIIPDHSGMILETVDHVTFDHSPDVVITTGGTGIGSRDVTIEALEPSLDKIIDGFGEIFRLESMKEIGKAAMLSRATAGMYNGAVVFCLPGSPNACETGLRIILEEIGHVVKHSKEKML